MKPKRSSSNSQQSSPYIDMRRIGVIILGGGRGTRLHPLTINRCKPAMCYGGRYRLIDIPISNAINSGCHQIYLLTQFLSRSLHHHISTTYQFSSTSPGFIQLLSAEETPDRQTWFQGTADAVRHHLKYFTEAPVDYFLILSGDQLYRMDFKYMIQFAQEKDADAVIAALPVTGDQVSRMGVFQIDQNRLIKQFFEKPTDKKVLNKVHLSPKQMTQLNLPKDDPRQYLGSMGIYLFKRDTLIQLLKDDPRDDFGQHLLPSQVAKGRIFAHIHYDYWEDIGTIASFYKANLTLVSSNPPFNCYDEVWPIFATPTNLPGAIINNTKTHQALFCEGSCIHAKEISNSIIGPRVTIGEGTVIRNSYIMGNNSFFPRQEVNHLPKTFGIGNHCRIETAVIDNNVSIGNNVQLINKKKLTHYDSHLLHIRDGIIVVPRGKVIPDGFIL